jgi:hypothetical protein
MSAFSFNPEPGIFDYQDAADVPGDAARSSFRNIEGCAARPIRVFFL